MRSTKLEIQNKLKAPMTETQNKTMIDDPQRLHFSILFKVF